MILSCNWQFEMSQMLHCQGSDRATDVEHWRKQRNIASTDRNPNIRKSESDWNWAFPKAAWTVRCAPVRNKCLTMASFSPPQQKVAILAAFCSPWSDVAPVNSMEPCNSIVTVELLSDSWITTTGANPFFSYVQRWNLRKRQWLCCRATDAEARRQLKTEGSDPSLNAPKTQQPQQPLAQLRNCIDRHCVSVDHTIVYPCTIEGSSSRSDVFCMKMIIVHEPGRTLYGRLLHMHFHEEERRVLQPEKTHVLRPSIDWVARTTTFNRYSTKDFHFRSCVILFNVLSSQGGVSTHAICHA